MAQTKKTKQKKSGEQKTTVGEPTTGKKRTRALSELRRTLAPKWEQYKKEVEKAHRDW